MPGAFGGTSAVGGLSVMCCGAPEPEAKAAILESRPRGQLLRMLSIAIYELFYIYISIYYI